MEKNRIRPITNGKSSRMSYSRQKEVLEMPNLIEVQKNSYEWFLDEGLKEVLDDISRRLNRAAPHVVLNNVVNVALQLIRRAIAVRSKERAVHAPKLIVLQKLLAESSSIDGFPIPPRGLSPPGKVIVRACAG